MRPLDGVRVLAIEQMQALPYATQLLARLGADVIKVEPPGGESGRGATPMMRDPEGRHVGATFLRNNFNKQSVCIDLKSPEGRELVLRLAPRFDVVAENSRAGAITKLGLGYTDVAAVHPSVIYVSVSGFGNTVDTPYASWPAYAAIVEAMSGIYDMKQVRDEPPRTIPVGPLGDMSAALFATVGILAALRRREATGLGDYVDIAMFDTVVAMTDVVTNLWSMGLHDGSRGAMICDGFRANDGWFVLQVGREHHFARLAEVVGCPEWLGDDRLATRGGWIDHLEEVIRPGIERWASNRTRLDACRALSDAGLAAGPCLTAPEVLDDEHLRRRSMLVRMPRTDGVAEPVVAPGNPVRLVSLADEPDRRVPWVGEHTNATLSRELGLDAVELDRLRRAGVIA